VPDRPPPAEIDDRRERIVKAIGADTACEPRRVVEISLCRHIADMLEVLAAERGQEPSAWIENAIEDRFFR
jgi:hypothetical protein